MLGISLNKCISTYFLINTKDGKKVASLPYEEGGQAEVKRTATIMKYSQEMYEILVEMLVFGLIGNDGSKVRFIEIMEEVES